MPTGSCLCEKIKVEYTGEPVTTGLCHCIDCRKISGGNYSNNFIVPKANFKLLSGTPKKFEKTADSGKSITSNFCGDCGTTVWRYGDSFGGEEGMFVIKAGILDDIEVLNSHVPQSELYAPERVKWVPGLEGAAQMDGMPPA